MVWRFQCIHWTKWGREVDLHPHLVQEPEKKCSTARCDGSTPIAAV